MTPEPEPTALYRLFGDGDELLYVGISKTFGARWHQHAKSQPWWPEVRRQSIDWHPSREAAEEAEKAAIKAENPKYNVMHSIRERPKLPPRPYVHRYDGWAGSSPLAHRWWYPWWKKETAKPGNFDEHPGETLVFANQRSAAEAIGLLMAESRRRDLFIGDAFWVQHDDWRQSGEAVPGDRLDRWSAHMDWRYCDDPLGRTTAGAADFLAALVECGHCESFHFEDAGVMVAYGFGERVEAQIAAMDVFGSADMAAECTQHMRRVHESVFACDICGRDFAGNPYPGGFLRGGYFYGPCCAAEEVKVHGQVRNAVSCPAGVSFENWVRGIRFGELANAA